MVEGKSQSIKVKALLTEYQQNLIQNKLGALRITCKSGKWIAQISVSVAEPLQEPGHVMGVDLGLKVSAVAVTVQEKPVSSGTVVKTNIYAGNSRLSAKS